MAQKRRQFTREFKLEAVRLVTSGERKLEELARDLGVRADILRGWKRQAEGRAGLTKDEIFPGSGKLTSKEEEIRALRRELEEVKQERDFLKKGGDVLREGVAVRYGCIEQHRGEFPVVLMCRVLKVTRSGYYAWRKREPSARARSDQRLRIEVRAIHRSVRGRYGSPRVHAELQARGERVSRKRVARLMRQEGLKGKKRRRFRTTTNSDHAHPIAPNALDRRFEVEEIGGPDQAWVADITYVPTREGWLYLAVILDLASRLVVGWSMGETLESSLAVDALAMALQRRRPAEGLLHHSDRGVQYASAEYGALLERQQAVVSMSRKGNCWDNAVAESFFATVEIELIEDADWHTRAEARRAIFEFIEVWYNRQRRHSSLGYLTPAEFDKRLWEAPRAALPKAA
ncbi:MAG TPA: IS3 family transposase [Longimicrobiaceae bacterium]